ncbi:MAG TPA: response regulator [Pseudobdellovibrionaceae bacterium]|mgnify:CR=1 FL=1|nr:response regulator [Pseudobdellovibrionaceae bacterium]
MNQKNKKILIVEDSLDLQRLLARLLQIEGYDINTANNGLSAFQQLERSPSLPNLILLDIMMPVMDGYAFRNRQKKTRLFSKIPTLILSADENVSLNRLKISPKNFIKKPIEIDQLLWTIQTTIDPM